MAIDPYYNKVVSEQAKGFVQKDLSEASLKSLLLLEEGLQALEAACSAIDQSALNTILTWRYAHSDMFMEDVLADQIKRGTISRYPMGWADNSRDPFFISDQVVDEASPFSLWAVHPFTIVVRELEHYPLLGFRTLGAYVAFMFLLRDRRYEEAILCLNGSARRSEGDENERRQFDDLFKTPVSAADFRLMLFLLYRALWSSFGGEKRGSELGDTLGNRLISAIQFPAGLPGENWYGELLMKVRRFMKK